MPHQTTLPLLHHPALMSRDRLRELKFSTGLARAIMRCLEASQYWMANPRDRAEQGQRPMKASQMSGSSLKGMKVED